MPTKIYADLSGLESWHRSEWERRLETFSQSKSGDFALASDRTSADFVLVTALPQLHDTSLARQFVPARLPRPNEFAWDPGDSPTGLWPGLYCSLPRMQFDARRHRTFCYPFVYNELVQPFDLHEARHLWGFMGGITSGLRGRMMAKLRAHAADPDVLLVEQAAQWTQIYDRSGTPFKKQYVDALRHSRFFLCPRGNGVGSIRLFETMKAARVPVIISDAFVLPAGVDWDSCAVRIKERDFSKIHEILAARREDWPRLAANARAAWEAHYSDANLLDSLGNRLTDLGKSNSVSRLASYESYARRILPALARKQFIRVCIDAVRFAKRFR